MACDPQKPMNFQFFAYARRRQPRSKEDNRGQIIAQKRDPTYVKKRQTKAHFKKQYSNTLLKKQVNKREIFNACKFFIENKSITGQSFAIDSGQSLNWQTKDLININE